MLSRRVAWLVVAVATFTMAVSYFDRATLGVLAPSVTKALDISPEAYGWLASAFSMAYLVSTPLAGAWIDRVGARRGLVVSVLAWSVVAGLHAVVPGLAMLFALRLALGLAEGPGFPGAAQTVSRVMPARDRARAFGVLFIGSSVGGLVAAPLASALYHAWGWRIAFLGSAVVGLSWVPMWILVTRRRDVRARLDQAGAADDPAAGEAKGEAASATDDGELEGRAGARTGDATGARRGEVTGAATGVASRAAAIARGAAATGPKPSFWELVRHPLMLRGLAGVFATATLVGFTAAWGAKYLDHDFGVKQEAVGKYLWFPPLLFDVGAIVFGDLASRQRRAPGAPPRLLFALAMLFTCTIALLPMARGTWDAVIIAGVALGGSAAQYTLIASDLLVRMPDEVVSLAGGILAGAQSLALIIMNPIVGWAVGRWDSYAQVAIGIGVWVLPGSLVWLAWRPMRRYGDAA